MHEHRIKRIAASPALCGAIAVTALLGCGGGADAVDRLQISVLARGGPIAPVVMITADSGRVSYEHEAWVDFKSVPPLSRYSCELDGKPIKTCRGYLSVDVDWGTHVVTIRASRKVLPFKRTPQAGLAATFRWTAKPPISCGSKRFGELRTEVAYEIVSTRDPCADVMPTIGAVMAKEECRDHCGMSGFHCAADGLAGHYFWTCYQGLRRFSWGSLVD